MKRETAPCQHDNSITQTQPRKGLDNHSPSAAELSAPGRTAEKENLRSQDREPTPVSCAKFTQLNERLCASIELTGAEMCRSFLLLFFEN